MKANETTRIILADAQPVFREGIKNILSDQNDFHIIHEAGSTTELIPALTSLQPHILILDYNPSYFDAEQLNNVLTDIPSCKVIIISSQEKKWNIFKSLEFNVYCYLTKECGKRDIHKAICAAIKGEKFFCSFIAEILLGEKKEVSNIKNQIPSCLTEREREITRLVALGKGNKEIAAGLNVSHHTVHTHRKNIMKKLGLHSAVELTNYAKENGIIF